MKKYLINKINLKASVFYVVLITICCSCKDFVTLEPPRNNIVPAKVFANDDLAIAAMTGVYYQMVIRDYASGDQTSISTIFSIVADEMIGYSNSPNLRSVYLNDFNPENSITNFNWNTLYARIYDVNSILEGVEESRSLTPTLKSQIKGEAHFIRALNYFYLINIYGDVPLNLNSDYTNNLSSKRVPVDLIYKQIISDLLEAEKLLNEIVTSSERVRPTKDAARALLARVYLYLQNWEEASKYSSRIIEKESLYNLVPLNEVFLKNSKESIWQLMPPQGSNTGAGSVLIFNNIPTIVSLRPDFVTNSFESTDKRSTDWIRRVTVGSNSYYHPYKYKVQSSTTMTEYHTVLRLAEQILIKAEASANQNNLEDAILNLDKVRARAGLSSFKLSHPNYDKDDVLNGIMRERNAELFSEWGHRWFDLKRMGLLSEFLSPIKPNWNDKYRVMPIPKLELDYNRNMVQNSGY